ncbi:MAG: TIGR02466 family protein [Pseudobdellovibrio sp.]
MHHSLFVTRVYQNKLKFNLKELVTEAYQIQKADLNGRKWSEENYPSGYTSYGSWDQLHQMSSTFGDLKKQLDLHVQKYVKQLDYELKKGDLQLNSLWLNIMGPGAQHTAHIHPHSVISGTFYVQTPPRCSAIKFEDPRLGFFMNAPVNKQSFVSLQPKAGEVILFESWLRHEVPRNETKNPRISISFNYGWSKG